MVDTSAVEDELREVYDPEIPVNIVDLGLVYDIREPEEGSVHVEMTLTSMGCPIADSIKRNVRAAVESADGVETASVELVWDPPWSPEDATEEGRLKLQSMGVRLSDSGEQTATTNESPF